MSRCTVIYPSKANMEASSMQGFTLHERQYILECRNAFVTGKYNANWGSLEHAFTDKKASTCTVHVQ